jgi:large subunit ribosomal protein L4
MATLDVVSPQGRSAGTVEASDALFAVEPNEPVMHQVVTAQLAARRAGTQSTKTRAEVAGGGAKPWRQKGTGRARHGSIRSPQWTGGGVALGPKPRSHRQRTPKKMIRLALASALSDRAADGRVRVLESWGIDNPSTRTARQVIEALGLEGNVLAVISRDDQTVAKSLRNLPKVHALVTDELNAYDVLVSDWVVFTKDSLP